MADENHVTFKRSTCRERCGACGKWWRSNLLIILLFLSVVAGGGVGYVLRSVPPFDQPKANPRPMMYLFFPAELMIRILTLISLPLIVTSLISGIGSLRAGSGGRIGLRTLAYYIGTTLLAVCEGFAFIYAIKPGAGEKTLKKLAVDSNFTTTRVEDILDMVRNVFPDNIITATFNMYSTEVTWTELEFENDTSTTYLIEEFKSKPRPVMNIMGLTFFSIVFGIGVSSLGMRGRLLVEIIDEMFMAIMKIVRAILWIYPIGVFFMIAHTVIGMEDPLGYLKQMAFFLVTVLGALLTHILLILPLLFLVFARRNPFKHFAGCFRALLTAFATSNSQVTMPVTMKCLEDLGMNSRIVRFMCPAGATVNMDGYALYEAMAAIFIATLRGMTPGPAQIATLGLTSVAVSMGAPTAGSNLVLLTILFNAVNLPVQDIALLIPLDWFLGRVRTLTNVWGDCIGVGVVQRWSRADLARSHHYDDDDSDADHVRPAEDALLTRYAFRDEHKDWTVRLINETGDRLVVSKV